MNRIQMQYFRWLGFVEGSSLLVLMFIAMPLKRVFGMPLAVTYVGAIHGILFVMYLYTLVSIALAFRWPWRRTFLAFICASVPFGTFWFDRKMLRAPEAP